MTKLFFLFAFISTSSWGGIENCFKDADDFGDKLNHFNRQGCGSLVSKDYRKIETYSATRMYRARGLKNIIVLDQLDPKTGKLLKSETLAGEQTGLTEVRKIWIDETHKMMFVLQKDKTFGLLTFNLAYGLSNTAPFRHFNSSILSDVEHVRYLSSQQRIILISSKNRTLRFINSDADNVRYHIGQFKPALWSEVGGPDTKLVGPSDAVLSQDSSSLFVLDQGRIVVYDFVKGKILSPKSVIPVEKATKSSSLDLQSNDLYVVTPTGRQKVEI